MPDAARDPASMPVTRDDVVAAYRLILGREPENEEIVTRYARRGWTMAELRREFMSSPEFGKKLPAAQRVSQHKPLNWPSIDVEVDAPRASLDRMVQHVEETWEQLGTEQPHWSVLTADKFKPEHIGQTADEFYETGRRSASLFQHMAARCGLDLNDFPTCLELGCGVGRVTVWLAELHRKVVAADISRPHLDLAASEIHRRSLANVELVHLRQVKAIESIEPFDCFFSLVVLQHNPPPVMKMLLTSVLRKLKPGGIAYFQVPTYEVGYRFTAADYVETLMNKGKMEMHMLPQHEVFRLAEAEGCVPLEVREDGMTGSPRMISNTFLLRKRHVG